MLLQALLERRVIEVAGDRDRADRVAAGHELVELGQRLAFAEPELHALHAAREEAIGELLRGRRRDDAAEQEHLRGVDLAVRQRLDRARRA